MQVTFVLLAALCLSAPVLSQNAQCKTIAGARNFNYLEFITNTYNFVLATETPITKTYASATETAKLVGDNYVSTFSATKKDGHKVTTISKIISVDGATLLENVLNNGAPTNINFKNTIYAYKSKVYAQFYVCGGPTQTTNDLRFAVVNSNTVLNQTLLNELQHNDDLMGFTGNLIRIGGGKLHDDDE